MHLETQQSARLTRQDEDLGESGLNSPALSEISSSSLRTAHEIVRLLAASSSEIKEDQKPTLAGSIARWFASVVSSIRIR